MVLDEDRSMMIKEIKVETNLSKMTVHKIIAQFLKGRKICAR